jgi:hypothetical protein
MEIKMKRTTIRHRLALLIVLLLAPLAGLQAQEHWTFLDNGQVRLTVRRDLAGPQEPGKLIGLDIMGRSIAASLGGELLQMLQRRPVASDRGQRRTLDMLVVIQEPPT